VLDTALRMVFIEPVLVNAHLMTGPASATLVTC
jgi:hypothetical protein